MTDTTLEWNWFPTAIINFTRQILIDNTINNTSVSYEIPRIQYNAATSSTPPPPTLNFYNQF
jgi:hypothetical protein